MKAFVFFLWMILTFYSFSIVPCWAESNKRPFWTKQSSFMEGEDLFVVGIAPHAATVEEGRKRAFENGKIELMNFARVTDVEAKGLVIETQMTYEEPNPIGLITVYQLLRVPAKKLIEIQGYVQEQTGLQEQAFDKSQRDLQLVQQAVMSRYQRLEEQNRQIQGTLDSVSRLQESLREKARRFEQAHTEVEQLLKQLSAKVKDTQPTSIAFASPAMNTNSTKDKSIAEPLFRRVKDTENKLDVQEAQLKELSKRAQARLAKEEAVINRYQRLEEQNRQIQETLDSMSRLQESLREKALKFEQNESIAEPLLRRIKDTEKKLDAQAAQLKDLSKRAQDRLAKEDELARALEKKCKYLVRGMTREEVGQIMSEPAEHYFHIPSKTTSSKYRYMNKRGATGIITIGFAFNELVDSLDGCPGKSFKP